MNQFVPAQPTLMSAIWPESAGARWIRLAVLAFVGTLIIAISAKIKVPFYPVPMTMQTFAILTLAAAYGWRLAGVTLALYLFEGAIGLPVFTGTPERGIGLAYMMGPTGGYLIGFVVGAMVTGYFVEKDPERSALVMGLAMLGGLAIIFALGIFWLGTVIGWDKPVLALGLYPFILGGLVKIALGVAVLKLGWGAVARWRGAA